MIDFLSTSTKTKTARRRQQRLLLLGRMRVGCPKDSHSQRNGSSWTWVADPQLLGGARGSRMPSNHSFPDHTLFSTRTHLHENVHAVGLFIALAMIDRKHVWIVLIQCRPQARGWQMEARCQWRRHGRARSFDEGDQETRSEDLLC